MIQHSDRNVSPAAYRGMGDDKLLVTSIFYTIQGEGPYAGCPALFVRLAGCNRGRKEVMGCAFCDTKFFFDKGKWMTFGEITDEMLCLTVDRSGIRIITVITGGEPMMQDNLSGFVKHHQLTFPARTIQIESNGDRLVDGLPDSGLCQLVVSPKVNKNGYHKPKDDVLNLAMCLKFVISADPDSPYHTVPLWAFDIRRERVYVSPMTVYKKAVPPDQIASAWDSSLIDHEATRKNYRHTAALALEHGFRVSIQQHLFYELE